MRKTTYVLFAALLVWSLIAQARAWHTGHLVVALTDKETYRPITNATVGVRRLNQTGLGAGAYQSHYTTTYANADSNGVVDVEFQFLVSHFDWWVTSETHYTQRYRLGSGYDFFKSVVEQSDYLDIDTNTVADLARYNELKSLDESGDHAGYLAKFEPKSVTYTDKVVYRSASFYPKHNPQPMYSYDTLNKMYLPMKNATVGVTNGVEVTHYRPVDLDMKECLLLPYSEDYDENLDGKAGEVSDIHVERFSVITNGVESFYGWIDFAPGCGAYIKKTTGDASFPTTYEADTNETFVSRIPFEHHSVSGNVIQAKNLLAEDEYMVLRTRVMTNSVGVVTNCNYSKILGPMRAVDEIEFTALIFNPRPNDTNLEFDLENNLAEDDGCIWYP